ncbi:MAG: hypothetical protein ACLTT1_13445 [[Clostridium] scindens]
MKKEPFVTKEQLEEIVKEYPTPFHLYDEKGLRRIYEGRWKEAFCMEQGIQGMLYRQRRLPIHF